MSASVITQNQFQAVQALVDTGEVVQVRSEDWDLEIYQDDWRGYQVDLYLNDSGRKKAVYPTVRQALTSVKYLLQMVGL